MEIQTPAPILMKFCMHIPTYPRKVLVQVGPPTPSTPGPEGTKTLKAEGHIFENCLKKQKMFCRLQINPGTSDSGNIKSGHNLYWSGFNRM